MYLSNVILHSACFSCGPRRSIWEQQTKSDPRNPIFPIQFACGSDMDSRRLNQTAHATPRFGADLHSARANQRVEEAAGQLEWRRGAPGSGRRWTSAALRHVWPVNGTCPAAVAQSLSASSTLTGRLKWSTSDEPAPLGGVLS